MFGQRLDLVMLKVLTNLDDSIILTIKGENVIFFLQDPSLSCSDLKRKMHDFFHFSSHGVFAQVQLFPLEAADGTFQPLHFSCQKTPHISYRKQ